MDFTFLQNIALTEENAVIRSSATDKTPSNGAHLRVFPKAVYPSVAFVAEHNLDYLADKDANFGLDVFKAHDWGAYPRESPNILLIAVVPKFEGKVDMFKSTKYNEEGEPKSDVLTQGAKSFAPKLWEMILELYPDTDISRGFIDLKLHTDHAIVAANGIYLVPKTITKGARIGEQEYIRRQNISVFPGEAIPFTENAEAVIGMEPTVIENTQETPAMEEAREEVEAEQEQQVDDINEDQNTPEAPVEADPFAAPLI